MYFSNTKKRMTILLTGLEEFERKTLYHFNL
jgi:hypothetical protein